MKFGDENNANETGKGLKSVKQKIKNQTKFQEDNHGSKKNKRRKSTQMQIVVEHLKKLSNSNTDNDGSSNSDVESKKGDFMEAVSKGKRLKENIL